MKLFVVASALAIAAHAQKITVTCNANDWAPRLVGMRIFEGRREEWRGDMRSVYFAQDLPQFHRIIRPGDFITSDYRPDRLNIRIDDRGTVVKVECN